MNISPIHPASKNVIGAIALLLSVNLLTSQMAQAQTFAGENQLTEFPVSLPALIYPTNNPQTFRVNVFNRGGGPLTIIIRDSEGNIKYTETAFTRKYIGRFDLSLLGAGTYTFDLSNREGQSFTRTFRIETPAPRVIALTSPFDKPFKPVDTLEFINPR